MRGSGGGAQGAGLPSDAPTALSAGHGGPARVGGARRGRRLTGGLGEGRIRLDILSSYHYFDHCFDCRLIMIFSMRMAPQSALVSFSSAGRGCADYIYKIFY